MWISEKVDYLVFYSTNKNNEKETVENVSFFFEYEEVLNIWTNNTRVSPLYYLSLSDNEKSLNDDNYELRGKTLAGKCYLLFIGPISPIKLDVQIFSKTNLWVSYGFYNVVSLVGENDIENIVAFLHNAEIRFEKWEVKEYIIQNKEFSLKDLCSKELNLKEDNVERLDLSVIKNYTETNILYSSLKEFLTLSKACSERMRYVSKIFTLELNNIIKFVLEYIKDPNIPELSKFGFLTTLNACLSRFTSQSLSGVSPINKTESHLWGHSLLGIGITNLALHNLSQFISEKIRAQEIPLLFSKFIEDNDKKEDLNFPKLECTDLFWFNDNLAKVNDISKIRVVPVISYFSGRDGFRSQHNTLSVPLESLYSCNTSATSLKTITHEISHIIIRACLPKVIPTNISNSEIDKLYNVFTSKDNTTFKKVVQSYVLKAFVMTSTIEYDKVYNAQILGDIIAEKYREVDEIMTHTFDYMYFYKWNTKSYLSELWSTWSEIPNIQDRIKEYSIRSICALMSSFIRDAECHVQAKDSFLKTMKELLNTEKRDSLKHQNMTKAISFVESHWNEEETYDSKKISLYNLVLRRRDLVKFTRTFLYSDKIAATIHDDKWLREKNLEQINKEIIQQKLIREPIGNALSFIDNVSLSKNKSISQSLIIYYALAFNYEQ